MLNGLLTFYLILFNRLASIFQYEWLTDPKYKLASKKVGTPCKMQQEKQIQLQRV